jgi:hypothetical protein
MMAIFDQIIDQDQILNTIKIYVDGLLGRKVLQDAPVLITRDQALLSPDTCEEVRKLLNHPDTNEGYCI